MDLYRYSFFMFSKLHLYVYGKLLTDGTWNLGWRQVEGYTTNVQYCQSKEQKFLDMQSVNQIQNLWLYYVDKQSGQIDFNTHIGSHLDNQDTLIKFWNTQTNSLHGEIDCLDT